MIRIFYNSSDQADCIIEYKHMADNPFYPGYKPEAWEGKPSEFYPGYFPGQPQPRRGFVPANVGPFPFDFDSVLAQINMVEGNVDMMTSGLPKWVYDRAVDDFKQNLKLQMRRADIKPEELDDFDADAIPGAFNISVSLNPLDWWNDPAKQAKKTIESWGKAAFSWQDIETRFRRDLWSQILDQNPNYVFAGSAAAAAALTERIGRPAGIRGEEVAYGNENPLALRGLGVMAHDNDDVKGDKRKYFDFNIERDASGRVVREYRDFIDPTTGATVQRLVPKKSDTKVDVYEQTGRYDAYGKLANSIIEFETMSGYAPKRQGAYTTVLRDTVHAINADLSQAKYRKVISADTERQRAFQIFQAQADTLSDMELLQKRYGSFKKPLEEGYLIKDDKVLWDSIDLFNSQIDRSLTNIENTYGVGKLIEGLDKSEAEKMRKFLNPYTKHLDSMKNNELLQLARVRSGLLTQQKDLTEQLSSGAISQAQFDSRIATVNKSIDDIQKQALSNRRRYIRDMKNVANGPFNGRGYLYDDNYIQIYERRLLEEVVAVDFMRPRARGKKKRIGDVVSEVPGVYASRALGLIGRLEYENQVMAIDEVFDALEQGKFLERYVWNKVKGYVEPFTPAYWTNKALEKVHYFGLKLGKDTDFETTWLGSMAGLGGAAKQYGDLVDAQGKLAQEYTNLQNLRRRPGATAQIYAEIDEKIDDKKKELKALSDRLNSVAAPSQFWGNWFSLDFDGSKPNRRGQIDPTVDGVRITGKLYGGAHFAGIAGLAQLRGMVHSGEWTPEALAYFIKNVGHDGFANPDFLKRLMALNGNRAIVLPEGMSPESFINQVITLREWVFKNKHRINANVDMNSDAFWLGFVDMVAHKMRDPDFSLIGITKRYAGLFEKLWNKFNELQTMLFKRFGKLLAPLAYVKSFIADRVADLIPKLLSIIGGAASGGTLAIVTETLGRILRPIIRFVVRKTLDFAQNFVGGIIRGDFFKALTELEKSVQAFIRAMLMLTAVPLLIIMAVTSMFFGASATTISPVDPTRSAGTIDTFESWVGGGGGSRTEIVNPISRPSSTSCFDFVDASGNIGEHPLGSWPQARIDALNVAITDLQAVSGGYLDRLCAAGTIELYWDPNQPGHCGHVYGSQIVFTNQCQYANAYYNAYLFAHETGHVYNNRVGWDSVPGLIQFAEVDDRDGGTLPTYPGNCSRSNTPGEDFAETIGNWTRINTFDCSGVDATLWSQFPAHYEFADTVLTRP